MSKLALPVVANAAEATFECIFGNGCEGLCCKNGRPSVSTTEQKVIKAILPRVMPHLRPEARELIESEGYLSNRTKLGQPMVRVVGGWCVFFNSGCTLHKVGIQDGDAYRYKPVQCALFPLDQDDNGEWFVRQWNYRGEQWDIFCLNPQQSDKPAVESLAGELKVAARCENLAAPAKATKKPQKLKQKPKGRTVRTAKKT
jgi:hypothetical protein